MQGQKKVELKIQRLELKVKDQGEKLRKLQGQKRGMERSRDNWKEKSKVHLRALRKKERTTKRRGFSSSESPKDHSYTSGDISIALQIRKGGKCSLRSTVEILKILVLCLGLEIKIPSHQSISLWEQRVGLHGILGLGQALFYKGEHVLILDESITVGKERILLILGVNLSSYKLGVPLKFEDVEVLTIGVSTSWKGEEISKEIKALENRGIKIKYAVCDSGPNLLNSLRTLDITWISDCTHALGKLLEKQYKTDPDFIAFSHFCGDFRKRNTNSKFACFMPQKQRLKGRFLNILPWSKWGKEMLMLYTKSKDLTAGERAVLAGLKKYEDLILTLHGQCEVMNKISKILKSKGLNKETLETCEDLVEKSASVSSFKQGVKQYLQTNWKEELQQDSLICTSDVIESIFGKYKNNLGDNPQNGITANCLNIANYGKELSPKEILTALNQTKIIDLEKWKVENIKEHFLKKKKELLKNCG